MDNNDKLKEILDEVNKDEHEMVLAPAKESKVDDSMDVRKTVDEGPKKKHSFWYYLLLWVIIFGVTFAILYFIFYGRKDSKTTSTETTTIEKEETSEDETTEEETEEETAPEEETDEEVIESVE